jgi:F-type H+-transporting ATPase subunit b
MSHDHLAAGINWWAWDPHRSPMGWFLLDFALFVALLVYFVAKPLRQALNDRHNTMRRAITQAAANHAKATSEQQLWGQKLAGLEAELRELEATSLADGEAEVIRMVADAEQRAAQVRVDAAAQLQQEQRRAHESVRRQSLAEVLMMAEEVLRATITPEDQSRLLDDASASLPQLPAVVGRKAQALGRSS